MKKHIIKIAAFLVGFLLINLLLCGFMPPDNGSSLAMWRNYHSKDSVDIAVIGSPQTRTLLWAPARFDPALCRRKNWPPPLANPWR